MNFRNQADSTFRRDVERHSIQTSAAINAALDRLDVLEALIVTGSGSPESAVTAVVGTLYLRTDGGTSTTLYVKESGSGNTGWVGK